MTDAFTQRILSLHSPHQHRYQQQVQPPRPQTAAEASERLRQNKRPADSHMSNSYKHFSYNSLNSKESGGNSSSSNGRMQSAMSVMLSRELRYGLGPDTTIRHSNNITLRNVVSSSTGNRGVLAGAGAIVGIGIRSGRADASEDADIGSAHSMQSGSDSKLRGSNVNRISAIE